MFGVEDGFTIFVIQECRSKNVADFRVKNHKTPIERCLLGFSE